MSCLIAAEPDVSDFGKVLIGLTITTAAVVITVLAWANDAPQRTTVRHDQVQRSATDRSRGAGNETLAASA